MSAARARLTRGCGWLRRSLALLCLSLTGLAAPALALAGPASGSADNAPQTPQFRAYNASDFALAYQAELEVGNQARAFAIAQQAVRQAPGDAHWRLRLAQVASWTQQPEVAAQQWSALFQMGDHSPATLDALTQLAPLLDDSTPVLQAWAIKADTEHLSAQQWNDVLSLYEQRAEPAQGSVFFEQQYRRYHDPALLENAARLAENAGDVGRTVLLSVERAVLQPVSVDWVLESATALIRWDCLEQARDLLLRVAPGVAADATDFWDLLGQVAWRLNDVATAERVYRQQIQQAHANADDWSRLVQLLRTEQPEEAIRLGLQAYDQFGHLEDLMSVLYTEAAAGDDAALERTLQHLQKAQLAQAEGDSNFLLLRASYYQRQQQNALAWADLEHAQGRSPESKDVALAALWFLINQQRLGPLQQALQAHAQVAQTQAEFWPAYAAGHQLLGHAQAALYWYQKQLTLDRSDPLLLLNYADALQAYGRSGIAERVRRHAWQLLHSAYAEQAPDLHQQRPPELLALARLMLLNRPDDPALRLVRQLVEPPAQAPLDHESAVLVLGWALGANQYANARSWMWQQFVQQNSNQAPAWAQAQIALQFHDQTAMQQLLDQDSPELPSDSRYDMAEQLGRHTQALDGSFQALEHGKDLDSTMAHMAQHLPLYADYVQIGWSSEDIASQSYNQRQSGALQIQTLQAETRLALSDQLQLKLSSELGTMHYQQPDFLTPVPDSERLTQAQLRWVDGLSSTTLAVFQRNSLQPVWGMHLAREQALDARWNLEFGLDFGASSSLSLPIRLGGYENDLYAALGYALSKREYLHLSLRQSDYYSAQGDLWASGNALDIEADYRIRLDYPDWRLRLIASTRQLTTMTDLGSFYIPANATTLSACVDMGSNLMGIDSTAPYSAAWRPFLDTCLSQNDQGASGWESGIGIAGSALGRDRLYLELHKNNDLSVGNTPGQTLALRYRRYF